MTPVDFGIEDKLESVDIRTYILTYLSVLR